MNFIKSNFYHLKKWFVDYSIKHKDNQLAHFLIIISCCLLFIFLALFIELTEDLMQNQLNHFDNSISNWVWNFKNPALTKFMLFVTYLGNSQGYIIVVLAMTLFFIWIKRWKVSLQITILLLISALSNLVLKSIFNRQRPTTLHMVFADSSSYPSGHAMSAMAFYGFLAYLAVRFFDHPWQKILSAIFCLFMILSIGISRVYLGVHYPSDIVAGYLCGLICIMFYILTFNLLIKDRQLKSKTANTIVAE